MSETDAAIAQKIKTLVARYKKTAKPSRARKPRSKRPKYKHDREGYDSPMYKQFVEAVKKRDGNRCQMPGCTKRKFGIEVHHIFLYKDFPSMRYLQANGICLCRGCHKRVTGCEEKFASLFINIVTINTVKQDQRGEQQQ
jgi:hypothetical protein